MADDKEKKTEKKPDSKGKVNDYNKISVKQKEYYYDRDETDKGIQKDFGDMMADLKATSMKFKDELNRGKPAKLELSSDALKGKEKSEKK